MGDLLGYARVSTFDQNPNLQRDALKQAGCYRVFTDKASGSLDARPQLAAVLDQLRPGDTLVVWRLDRLGRSLRHLIDTVADLQDRKIGFRSLTEQIDTTTAGGKLVLHLFGALAEFERDLIRDRTMAGLAAARARGRVGGRPSVMTADKLAVARRMYDEGGHTMEAIAQVVGVSRATLYRHLAPAAEVERDGDRVALVARGAPAKEVRGRQRTQSRSQAGARGARNASGTARRGRARIAGQV